MGKYMTRIVFEPRIMDGSALTVFYAERCPTCGKEHEEGSRGYAIKEHASLRETAHALRELAAWIESTPGA